MQGSGTIGSSGSQNTGGTQSLPNGASADQQFAEIASEFRSAIDQFSDTARRLGDARLMQQQAPDGAQGDFEYAIAHAEAGTVFGYAERPDMGDPAADGTFGKTEYGSKVGETPPAVAAQFGQSVEDLLLANPGLPAGAALKKGTVVAIYDATRLDLVRRFQSAASSDQLKDLAHREILYATVMSPTPEDLLPAVMRDLMARRPGDEQFAKILKEEGAAAVQFWSGQGRTHEVMDRLAALSGRGDNAALRQEVFDLFASRANENATPQAIQDQRDVLLAYGPADGLFTDAVNAAELYFNIGQVVEAAARIAQTYTDLGPVEAARMLAQYTSESDPLTGARILNAAEATISQIITHIGVGEYHDWPGAPGGEPRSFKSDIDTKEQIFGFLSAAVERPSQSTEAAEPIGAMAQRINEELYRYVVGSIIDGNGLTLPFNMLNLLPEDLVLRMLVYGGVSGLTTRLSGENHVLTSLARFDPEAARLINSMMDGRLADRLNMQDHYAVNR